MSAFFPDFSKGFDLVDHNVIMQELELLGVNNHITRWIGEFSRSRSQCVKIGDAVSPPVFPHGGIPQGTRLAPFLFAILVNRLVRDWPNRVKYVDDTTIYEVIPRCSPSYLPIIANEIYSYASQHGMRLNPTKCRELVVNFLQNQPSSLSPLQLSGTTIQRMSTYKILGVHISEDLTWNMHTDYVFKEANKRLYAFKLLKKSGVATEDLVKIYCSLIRSVLEYAAPVWSDLPDHYLASVVESIQKKALKIIVPTYLFCFCFYETSGLSLSTGQTCPEGRSTNRTRGPMRGAPPYPIQTRKTRPQHRELHALLFTTSVRVLLRPTGL